MKKKVLYPLFLGFLAIFILVFSRDTLGVLAQNPGDIPEAPPPPPVCTERQYNECVACNTSRSVVEKNCDGNLTWDVGPDQEDAACGNLCPVPAAAAPAPSCPAQACDEDVTYCDAQIGRMVRKHGGYWDSQKCQCVYNFDNVNFGLCPAAAPAPAVAPAVITLLPAVGAPLPVPAPAPAAQPAAVATAACPSGTTQTVQGSTIVCVAQSQQQTQGPVTQTNTQTVNVTGASPAPVAQAAQASSPKVLAAVAPKVLPKTGAESLAIIPALGGLWWLGRKLRKNFKVV